MLPNVAGSQEKVTKKHHGAELAQHPYCHILSVKANHKAIPYGWHAQKWGELVASLLTTSHIRYNVVLQIIGSC